MSAPVILELNELRKTSSSEVGTLGTELAKLNQLAVPLPKSLIIPRLTLEKLSDDLQIAINVKNICQNINWSDPANRYHAKQAIANQVFNREFPNWFSQKLYNLYHSQLKRGLVRILPGSKESSLDVTRFEHIQGDSNLFESLKQYWLHWLEHEIDLASSVEELHIIPTAIIMQEQSLALVSGKCYSYHPQSGNKSQIFISAIKGAPASELFEDHADQYVVDVRTDNVVFREVKTQTRYFQRSRDQLISRPLDHQAQLSPNLTDEQCVQLAKIVLHLKHQQLSHFKLDWELTHNGFIITQYDQDDISKEPQTIQQKTITKIYLAIGNPHQINSLPDTADGIGVFDSQYAYLDFGIHPQQICHSRIRETLIKHLVASVKQFHESMPHRPIVYQTMSLNSRVMSKMRYGAQHEQAEPNPSLGMRGGMKYLVEPALFELDLEVIKALLNQTNIILGLQLTMIRSPQELSLLIDRIYEAGLSHFPTFELWWQLDTPDNILNLAAYPTHHLTGLAINIEELQTLVYGVDQSNHYLFDRYSFDDQSLTKLMGLAAKFKANSDELSFTNQHLQLRLQLSRFNRQLVEEAVDFGYDGITISPPAFSIAKTTVIEAERKKFKNHWESY